VLHVTERHHHLDVRLEQRLAVLAVQQLRELVADAASALRNATSSLSRARTIASTTTAPRRARARPRHRLGGVMIGTLPITSPVAGL
jgi:hypothetical protein